MQLYKAIGMLCNCRYVLDTMSTGHFESIRLWWRRVW